MRAPRILLTSLLAVSVLAGLIHNEQDSSIEEIGAADASVESPKKSHHLNIHHVETDDNVPSQLQMNQLNQMLSQKIASIDEKTIL